MWYVGLDLHWRTSTMCILDHNGKEVKTRTVRGDWDKVLAALRELPRPFALAYEASCGYGYVYDKLLPIAQRVVVAHPGQLRLIFRSTRKNDRVDAGKLAKLLYLDEVPPVYVPSPNVRAWRSLIEYRRRTIDKRTRTKNALRALLRSCGIVAPGKCKLWTAAGRTWLEQLPLEHPVARVERRLLLAELAQFDEQVRQVTAELDRLAAQHPGMAVLQTIPGIGPRTAEAMLAYVDEVRRFQRNKQVGAYFGLVPRQDASGSVNHLGHISKNGPATVRKLLVEAAWQVIRRSALAKQRFERLQHGQRERRKIALVAVAQWLVRCMTAMLRTGEVWREGADAEACSTAAAAVNAA